MVLVGFLTTNKKSYSQLSQGDSFISLKTGLLNLNNYSQRNVIGAEVDIMVSDHIGIHYNFLFGRKYFHAPAAPIGGAFAFIFLADGVENLGGAILVGALLTVIPEGVSFNTNLNPNMSLGVKLSPLEFDFIRNENQEFGTDSFVGCSAGLKFSYLFDDKRFRISPFGDYKLFYHKNKTHGFFAGISIGYNLSPQNNDTFEFN